MIQISKYGKSWVQEEEDFVALFRLPGGYSYDDNASEQKVYPQTCIQDKWT